MTRTRQHGRLFNVFSPYVTAKVSGPATSRFRSRLGLKMFRLCFVSNKMSNVSVCGNFSLSLHASKIVLRILARRLENKAELFVERDQYGFRKGLGTRDAIAAMRTLNERSLDRKQREDESAWKCSATSQARLRHFEERCRKQKQLAEDFVINLPHGRIPKREERLES